MAIMSFRCLWLLSQLLLTVGFGNPTAQHEEPGTVGLRTLRRCVGEGEQQRSTFKIAIFSDLHFGENPWTGWGPRQDVKSIRVMSSILDQETPDFVVYLGDVVTANNVASPNASLYWDQAMSPTRERGIPSASVFGNHDDAQFVWPLEWFSGSEIPSIHCNLNNSSVSGQECFRGTPRVELINSEIKNNNLSLSRNGPGNLWPSISNYVIQVYSSKVPGSPVALLYFLDSGGGSYPEVISRAQAKWFKHQSQNLNPSASVPELMFWHIPSKAFEKVAPVCKIRQPCVGSIYREKVASQAAEMGIMKLLVKRTSVKAVFVGHNHGLDWCCPHKKLWLCFARHTGYGGYGHWARGARILEISEQPFSLKSWIRMENGHSHSEVLLSS